MKRFKLFFMIPALILPLSLTGCNDGGTDTMESGEITTEETVDGPAVEGEAIEDPGAAEAAGAAGETE